MINPEACHLTGAYWIKPSREAYEQKELTPELKENRFIYYRLVVHLDEPVSLELSISANSRYRLWINGRPVLSGPCKGDRWRHYYETFDATPFLKAGLNIFAVQVWSLNTYMINDPKRSEQPLFTIATLPVGPRLAVSGLCKNKEGEATANLATGLAEWLVSVDDAIAVHSDEEYTIFMGAFAERVQAARIPEQWKSSPTPGGSWSPAEVAEPCLGRDDAYPLFIVPQLPLVRRPIPLLYEKHREFVREMPIRQTGVFTLSFDQLADNHGTVEVPPHTTAVIELDAGELTTGHPAYPMDQGDGACVVICYAERYFQPGNEKSNTVRDDVVNGMIKGYEDVYYPSGRSEIYEPFWLRAFRFIRIEVRTADQPLLIRRPWFRESAYPLEAKSFVSSSASWIDSLWRVSLRTLQLCMHETYEDCPYYEQMQFIMDTRLQALFTYSVGGDTGLAQKALEDFHSSLLPEGITQDRFPSAVGQIIPSFSLHFIFMLRDYYWQTGDRKLVRRYRSTLDAILDWFDRRIGESGLVERIGYWEYIDWVPEWREGEPSACKTGPSTIHNLIYAAALQAGAELNAATGRSQVGEEYQERWDMILAAIERLCWSEEKGMYREGPAFEQYSQHAQLWAVLAGLCKEERAKRVMTSALDEPGVLKCSFSMSFFLFRALERAGLYHRTIELFNLWRDLLPLNITTLPETPWEPRSDCHAWSALPLYEFTHCLLGVKAAKPGWAELIIEPDPLNLEAMSGEVHTPTGVVSVVWRRNEETFSVWGQAPSGIPFTVRLPGGIERYYAKGGSFSESVSLFS
ncbi:alpha-L-rhamnosidase-related protein [Paenibacillus sp. TH7-28]